VTTGEAWQFARWAGSVVFLEPERYYLDKVDLDKVESILGAFHAIINECRK
jgi:hypothetical protein